MRPEDSIPIAICADDFGLEAGINKAILSLVRQGRISAVSCMTTVPLFRHVAQELSECDADIGLHLNFTEQKGDLELCLPTTRLIVQSFARRLDKARVAAQIIKQLDAFDLYIGRAPDFVDGHEHVHQFPVVRDALLEVLAQRYPNASIWVRNTRARCLNSELPIMQRFKARVIGALGAAKFVALAHKSGRQANLDFLGVYDFNRPHPPYSDLLTNWLSCAQSGALLMTHPATEVLSTDLYGQDRVAEFEVLGSDQFAELLCRLDVIVRRMSLILKQLSVESD